jgi:hypothetical protein
MTMRLAVLILASFASLQLAPWNILTAEALWSHPLRYSTGRAPWNTATTEVEMYAHGLFHRASHLHCLRFA